MTDELTIFLSGMGGSAAIEILTIHQIYLSGTAFPKRYKRFGFWITRALLAAAGGGLAFAYGISEVILAVNIGAATPLILSRLTESVDAQIK